MDNILIASTRFFEIKVPNLPHIPREDGGHIFIESKLGKTDRSEFTQDEAIECIWLTILVGDAYWDTMIKNGVELYKINYQDNGNWAYIRKEEPTFHIHIYGRAKNEKYQAYGQALMLPYSGCGFYDDFEQINEKDIELLRHNIDFLSKEDKYRWRCLDRDVAELRLSLY